MKGILEEDLLILSAFLIDCSLYMSNTLVLCADFTLPMIDSSISVAICSNVFPVAWYFWKIPMLSKIAEWFIGHPINIVRTPPPPPLPVFKSEEVNFNSLPRRGEIWKIKNRVWNYGAGAGILKRGGLALFPFNFFKVYHYCI